MGAVSSSGCTTRCSHTTINAVPPADVRSVTVPRTVPHLSDTTHYLKKLRFWLVHVDGFLVTKEMALTYFNTVDGDSRNRDRVVRFSERPGERRLAYRASSHTSKGEDVLR